MSLETPIKIRMLQRKLYQKAKEEPDYRFYLLYDKVYREDILCHAYALARSNQGAPGVDGQSFAGIEAAGLEEWLKGIRNDLRAKTYRPQAVRRVNIPKPGGGERPLGIPTIRDRVVQTAAKLVLEPIFEADFDPNAYGYRPKRSAQDAIRKVHELLREGYTDVVDADLSKYFDTIPHRELLRCVARRIVDRDMLHLIKMWLKVPVEERSENGKPRVSGGQKNMCGTPQGGVISPLLANLYMNRFLKYWRITGKGERFRAQVVNYADDFVILSRGHAVEALDWTRGVMGRIGLTLNEAKTHIRKANSGFTGAGSKTVIPSKAMAKVSFRLVPNQDPDKIVAAFRKHVEKYTPKGIHVEVRVLGVGPGLMVNTDHPAIQVAASAMEDIFGKPTVFTRSGGSIPIVGDFKKHLGIPTILMGFGLPDDGLHSPNEKFSVENYYKGIRTVAHFFEKYGATAV